MDQIQVAKIFNKKIEIIRGPPRKTLCLNQLVELLGRPLLDLSENLRVHTGVGSAPICDLLLPKRIHRGGGREPVRIWQASAY